MYRARLRSNGEEVAVKVQRPGALGTISKVRRGPSRWGDWGGHSAASMEVRSSPPPCALILASHPLTPVPSHFPSSQDLYVLRRIRPPPFLLLPPASSHLPSPANLQDLYVLRRAIGAYEQIVKRFTAQTTDYQELLSTFAEVCLCGGVGES